MSPFGHFKNIGLMYIAMSLLMACNRGPANALKRQSNTTITFYGQVVDQDGAPLAGAKFEYFAEAYPKGWSYDGQGRPDPRPDDTSTIHATSDANGRFQFTMTGHLLRLTDAERAGYHHFYDLNSLGTASDTDSFGYCLIASGGLQFRMDPGRPAVYVFVKDGVQEVSALICRGGLDHALGTNWLPHDPGWPE